MVFGLFRDAGAYSSHPTWCRALLPAFFSVSHLHRVCLPGIEVRRTLVQAAVVMAYTWLFGYYSACVFTWTGSLWPAVALHAQCNWFGVPNFGPVFDYRVHLMRRILIGSSYLVGIVLYFWLIRRF